MCLGVHEPLLCFGNRYGKINDYVRFSLYLYTFICASVYMRKYSFKYWVQLAKGKKKNHKWSSETVNKNRMCNAVGPCGLPRKNPLLLWWVGLSVVTIMLLEMKTKLCSPVFNWQCHNAFRDEMQVLWHNSSHDSCGSIIYLHKTPMTASILFLLWVKYDVLAMFWGFTDYGYVHIVCNQVHA